MANASGYSAARVARVFSSFFGRSSGFSMARRVCARMVPINGVFTPYTVCGNCLMLAWNDQLTAPRDKAFRKARRSQPGDMKQKTIVRSQRFVTALQVHLKQGTRAILQPLSGAPAPTAGRYFQSGSDRAPLDPAPVWSSAFRRFGAFTHPGRINAELQTQRQRSSGAVFRCTRSHPRSLAIF